MFLGYSHVYCIHVPLFDIVHITCSWINLISHTSHVPYQIIRLFLLKLGLEQFSLVVNLELIESRIHIIESLSDFILLEYFISNKNNLSLA